MHRFWAIGAFMLCLIFSGCKSVHDKNTSLAGDRSKVMGTSRSIKSYMAEMEEYFNDVFRFYDDESMQGMVLEQIDLVIKYHDGYIGQDPEMFSYQPEAVREELRYLYKYHTLKSKRLFQELKAAIIEKDYEEIKSLIVQLDENRRDSHTIFG